MKLKRNQYDIVRHSQSLRAAIKTQLSRKGMTVGGVCNSLGIHPSKMYEYLKGSTSSIPQYKILLFCQKIGVDVSLTIRLDD